MTVVEAEIERLKATGAVITHVYDGTTILGFAAVIPDDQLSK
jgi:hypothetical protein